ncbi:unnamed protein product [Pleuronectes platessa]|uniref:Uncharacterized protein n=1 Tax=Pleuronectes platessa TaxID=8262 RepID=A0A9N7YKQ6_PLEPL|nr:unnamed protein product [Pleuronectes platessa]
MQTQLSRRWEDWDTCLLHNNTEKQALGSRLAPGLGELAQPVETQRGDVEGGSEGVPPVAGRWTGTHRGPATLEPEGNTYFRVMFSGQLGGKKARDWRCCHSTAENTRSP